MASPVGILTVIALADLAALAERVHRASKRAKRRGLATQVFSARFHLLAVKGNSPKLKAVEGSIASTEPSAPMQERGQAYVDGRGKAREEAIRKGLARLAEYTPAELAERTLNEGDGQ